MSLLNRSALLVTLAPLEGNEDFDALSSAANILYVAAVAGLSASKRRKLPPHTAKGGRLQPAPGGEPPPAPGGRPRRRERDPAPGKRESSQPGAGKEESFHREKKNLSKEEIVTC